MKIHQYITLFSAFVFIIFGVSISHITASNLKDFSHFYENNQDVGNPTSDVTKLLNNDRYQIRSKSQSQGNVDICPHGYIQYETTVSYPQIVMKEWVDIKGFGY